MKPGTALGVSLAALVLMVLFYAWQPMAEAPLVPVDDDEGEEELAAAPAVVTPPEVVPTQPPARTVEPRAQPEPSARKDPSVEVPDEFVPSPVPPQRTGPIEELKQQYESDDADAEASTFEAKLRAMSGTEFIPPGSIRGVRCTRRVCKIDMLWSPQDNGMAYMAVGMLLHAENGAQVAIEPDGEPSEEGEVELSLYVTRTGPGDTKSP